MYMLSVEHFVHKRSVLCICTCTQIVEWTKCVVKKLETWFNVFVKLMLFHNIKRSLKVT